MAARYRWRTAARWRTPSTLLELGLFSKGRHDCGDHEWYRDHDDGTGWHADRPADTQPETTIPVLSLGATRRFLIRPKAGGPSTAFTVAGGDLVVMGGRCQRDHEHMVPKQRSSAAGRMSLNFSGPVPGDGRTPRA